MWHDWQPSLEPPGTQNWVEFEQQTNGSDHFSFERQLPNLSLLCCPILKNWTEAKPKLPRLITKNYSDDVIHSTPGRLESKSWLITKNYSDEVLGSTPGWLDNES